jgi:hypothetical protein
MQEFFNKIKTANWKRIGHWAVYPPSVLLSKFAGGLLGVIMYKVFIFGLIRADVIEYADGAFNQLFNNLTISIGTTLAGLFAAVNFIPNKDYKHNALYLVAGISLGVDIRNFAIVATEQVSNYRISLIASFADIVLTSFILYYSIKHVYESHPQRFEEENNKNAF